MIGAVTGGRCRSASADDDDEPNVGTGTRTSVHTFLLSLPGRRACRAHGDQGKREAPSRYGRGRRQCAMAPGRAPVIAWITHRRQDRTPPPWSSFGTAGRRGVALSHWGLRLEPAPPVLTVGVSRRFRSVA